MIYYASTNATHQPFRIPFIVEGRTEKMIAIGGDIHNKDGSLLTKKATAEEYEYAFNIGLREYVTEEATGNPPEEEIG